MTSTTTVLAAAVETTLPVTDWAARAGEARLRAGRARVARDACMESACVCGREGVARAGAGEREKSTEM